MLHQLFGPTWYNTSLIFSIWYSALCTIESLPLIHLLLISLIIKGVKKVCSAIKLCSYYFSYHVSNDNILLEQGTESPYREDLFLYIQTNSLNDPCTVISRFF